MLEYERQAEERAREAELMAEERERMLEDMARISTEQNRIAQEEYEMKQYYEAEALKHAEEVRLHQDGKLFSIIQVASLDYEDLGKMAKSSISLCSSELQAICQDNTTSP